METHLTLARRTASQDARNVFTPGHDDIPTVSDIVDDPLVVETLMEAFEVDGGAYLADILHAYADAWIATAQDMTAAASHR